MFGPSPSLRLSVCVECSFFKAAAGPGGPAAADAAARPFRHGRRDVATPPESPHAGGVVALRLRHWHDETRGTASEARETFGV